MSCHACENTHLGQHVMTCVGCRVRLAEAHLRVQGLRTMAGYLDIWDSRYGPLPEVRERMRVIVEQVRQQRKAA